MAEIQSLNEQAQIENYQNEVKLLDGIPARWQGTPIEKFILAHNKGQQFETVGIPELMIVTCIDYRINLRLPEHFAFVLRRAAASLSGLEFNLSYALSKGVEHLAILAHSDCAMTRVSDHRAPILNELIRHGWQEPHAESFVDEQAEHYAIAGELDALRSESKRISCMFNKLEVAPLFLDLEENRIVVPDFR